MIRLFAAIAAAGIATSAAFAQDARQKLEAPGKVPFGTTYADAAKILGKSGQAMGKDDLPDRFKADGKGLSCDDCNVPAMPNIEGVTLYFARDRLVRVEHFANLGAVKTLDECVNTDDGMLALLTRQYGAPASQNTTTKDDESVITASFHFNDAAAIEYEMSFGDIDLGDDKKSCAVTIRYMQKDGR